MKIVQLRSSIVLYYALLSSTILRLECHVCALNFNHNWIWIELEIWLLGVAGAALRTGSRFCVKFGLRSVQDFFVFNNFAVFYFDDFS